MPLIFLCIIIYNNIRYDFTEKGCLLPVTYDYSEINRYITEKRIDELIEISERRIQLQFETLFKLIRVKDRGGKDDLTDIIMISGPSSSGKTTTANLIADFMRDDGYNCTVISLDDYYYDMEINRKRQVELGLIPEGSTEFDFETIEAIDIDLFRKHMREYTSGHSIELPSFDFTTGKRAPGGKVTESTHKDMIILEGIHAFSPRLTEGLPFDTSLKIYVCPLDSYTSEYNGISYTVEPHQIRFMRRAIRDNAHRAASLARTLDMWPGVRRGEKNYIEPLLPQTDIFINSSYEYEIVYLKEKILEMASESTPETKKRFASEICPESLYPFMGMGTLSVPSRSIFNEFYTG